MWLNLKLSAPPKDVTHLIGFIFEVVNFFGEVDNFRMSHIQTSHFQMSQVTCFVEVDNFKNESHSDESLPDVSHSLKHVTHPNATNLNMTHF